MLFVFIFYSINFLGIKNVVNESNFSARMRKIDTTEVTDDGVINKVMYAKMKEIGDDFDDNLHYMGRWVKKRRIVRTATLR